MKKRMMVGVCAAILLTTAAHAQWSTQAFTNDAQLPIGTDRTYTHAFNIGGNNVMINGVTFLGAGTSYTGKFTLSGTGGPLGSATGTTSGNINTLLSSFYYNGNPAALMLYGLQVGSDYVVRFYVHAVYGGCPQLFAANDNVDDSLLVNRDGGQTPGAVISRTITAQAGGVVAVCIAPQTGHTFHIYGFSLEKAATPASRTHLIADLFNTGVDANGVVQNVGTSDPHYTVTGPAITERAATVMTPHANWTPASFTRWIGPTSGSAGGVSRGTYSYTTTFTIGENDRPRTAVITGHAFADDVYVNIYLNNVKVVASGYFHWITATPGSAFSIVHGQNGAIFQKGANTLKFEVPEPGGGPHGLRVYGMKGTVEAGMSGTLFLVK